jgi:type IV secretion system protein VirB1
MMKFRLVAAFAFAAIAAGQHAPTLSGAAFAEVATRCAPSAPLATLRSIVSYQSAFHPFALTINYPEAAGAQLGIGDGSVTLARQPGSLEEAVRWSRWFLANGQTVSVGLMQLSIEHLAAFKISLEKAFDSCTNLKLGWTIFGDKYAQASAILGKGQLAMQAALAAFNSGSLVGGFRSGYVEDAHRRQHPEDETVEPSVPYDLPRTGDPHVVADKLESGPQPPLRESEPEQHAQKTLEPNPRAADTRVIWDLPRARTLWPVAKP